MAEEEKVEETAEETPAEEAAEEVGEKVNAADEVAAAPAEEAANGERHATA